MRHVIAIHLEPHAPVTIEWLNGCLLMRHDIVTSSRTIAPTASLALRGAVMKLKS